LHDILGTANKLRKEGIVEEAIKLYMSILELDEKPSEETNKAKEEANISLSGLFRQKGDAIAINHLLKSLRQKFFSKW